MLTDYYELLGVERDASADQIKKAYRKAAMRVHPDVAPGPDAAEKFKQVNEAYEVLSDSEKRSIYDRGGDPRAARRGGGGYGGGFGGFQSAGFGEGFDVNDLFGAMFGQSAGGRGPRSRTRRGQDALIRLELDLSEAAFGVTKPLRVDTADTCSVCQGSGAAEGSEPQTCDTCHGHGEIVQVQRSFIGDIRTSQPCPTCRGYGTVIPQPCLECDGEGRVRTSRTINVKIPAGVATGNRVHLDGKGEAGPGGGPNGDLYVELLVRQHPTFKREGDNLEMVCRLPMTAAALGTEIIIDTLEADLPASDEQDRTVRLEVPAGTQSGTRLVVRGRGIPRLRGSGRGELGVTLLIQTPTKLNDRQRELLQEFAQERDELDADGATVSSKEHKEHKGFFDKIRDAFN
ncbi:molecular chaperone DnaJ [Parenemella sanctibonifatiensis]|uniref:Chaperone protein DnaJ n=1 Tax=Parenemella sanctibonifatiensis TaxID=2016505 RepID=A0A255E138_9ACTN|nr:molecular chaperone DnaJ [Parenemella sanctibonifatiensis]OYN85278.1 molecular chaperone DnaJ [Parenemella sanctibonifatiensis]